MEPTIKIVTDDPDEARNFIIETERSGVDVSRLRIHSRPPVDSRAMSIADGRYMRRTGSRVAKGIAVGAAVAIVLWLALALSGTAVGSGLVLISSIGLLLGGALVNLYAGMSASGATAEADHPGPTVVELTNSAARNSL